MKDVLIASSLLVAALFVIDDAVATEYKEVVVQEKSNES